MSNVTLRRSHRSYVLRLMRNKWRLYVLLLIPVVYVIMFKYVPMYGILMAFKNYKVRLGIMGSPWVGFKNFTKYFESFYFERTITNTLSLSVYSLLISYPLSVAMALLLNACPFKKYRSVVENVTYMPHFISTVVMVGMLFQVFNVRTGLYGNLYQMITGKVATDLLASPTAFPHMYVWSGVWQGLGWGTIIYIAALSAVDSTLHEAAVVDGATRLQRLLHIDIPSILPTLMIQLVLASSGIMAIGFDKVYLMQNDLNIGASEVISTYTYKVAFGSTRADYSYSSAIGLFNSLVNGTMLVIVNYITGKLSGNSLW